MLFRCKDPNGLYSTDECIKIQHHAVTLPPNCLTWMELGHPAPCKVSLSGLYSTESIKIQHNQPVELDGFGDVRVVCDLRN